MAWKTITTTEVEDRLAAAEYTALTTVAKRAEATATSLVEDAIEDVVRLVRGFVAACRQNTLGAGQTIPNELDGAALALIRRHLFTRLPGMGDLYDESRQKETSDALSLLRDVARCNFVIEQPATATTETVASPEIGTVRSVSRQSTRERMTGL